MKHSKNFTKVEYYYDSGIWPLSRVYDAVGHGWITPEEFEDITGCEYKG